MIKNNQLISKIENYLPYIFLAVFIIIGFYLRLHNVLNYNTYWADDGGGHIKYMETIYYQHRLPFFAETYLAWHEPLYYALLYPWLKINALFGAINLSWAASLNIIIYGFFLLLVWKLSCLFFKSSLVSAISVSLFSVIFVGVKLSAYINNELLAQTYILLLIYLFIKDDLLAKQKTKKIILWSVLLSVGLWIKLTVLVVLLSALTFFIFHLFKRKYLWKYILIIIIIPLTLNVPWLIYKKNNFGSYFTINIYDTKPRQSIVSSDAWSYIFRINKNVFLNYPYWYKLPHSYFSILLSDSFGDYYNLFNDYVKMEELPKDSKILVGNGRYTTPEYWQSMLNTNRLALVFFVSWLFGFLAYLYLWFRKKIDRNNYQLFWLIALLGGWAALLYQNLRLPYLEAGVLKAHFIYYTYPLFTIPAYLAIQKIIKNKLILYTVLFLPLFLYLYYAWRILSV